MSSALWYLGRGSGVVSLVLLTLVVALGIATRSGRPMPGLPRFAVAAVHRNASLLAVVFLGIHVTTLLADPYAQLKLVDLVLPFAGIYRPFWLGLGTVGLDLMAALVITSLARSRLGVRTWRAVHWLAYATWPVAILHSLGTGTDAGRSWMLALAALSAAAVVLATIWRCTPSFAAVTRPGRRAGQLPPAPSTVGRLPSTAAPAARLSKEFQP